MRPSIIIAVTAVVIFGITLVLVDRLFNPDLVPRMHTPNATSTLPCEPGEVHLTAKPLLGVGNSSWNAAIPDAGRITARLYANGASLLSCQFDHLGQGDTMWLARYDFDVYCPDGIIIIQPQPNAYWEVDAENVIKERYETNNILNFFLRENATNIRCIW
ncbi:protein of unknown function [uncultured Woeseiaceae bacterium]|uniref:Uncharacterized protein n=1 Tax=uncultured Woeseiaceae bacterium TaxID=1983305 RepID=A0A7D9H3Q6_9GAMM|nr:protein of unknown function [uncultured Woeseiaceae bacterium]